MILGAPKPVTANVVPFVVVGTQMSVPSKLLINKEPSRGFLTNADASETAKGRVTAVPSDVIVASAL